MTVHPAWPQPQYERIRAGLSPRLRDVAARASYVLSTGSRSRGPAGAVEAN